MKKLYIIKTGTTFPEIARQHGDFDDWVRTGLGIEQIPVVTVNAQNGASLPDVQECAGVVVTGSHEMVTDWHAWSVGIEAWIPSLLAAEIPFLGICYGHQLLVQSMGGTVGYHPDGSEAGTVDISLLPSSVDDVLFAGLPTHMPVHVIHEQTVISLPPGAVRLALNEFESTHAFRLGPCAWGVQFHPEYDERVMMAYLLARQGAVAQKNRQVQALLDAVGATPQAATVLKRFGRFVEERQVA